MFEICPEELTFTFFFLIYLFHCTGLCCGMWDLVSQPGTEPRPPTLGAHSHSHWTTREVPEGLRRIFQMEKLPTIARDYDGAKNGCKVAGQAPVNLGYVCGSGGFPGGPSGREPACQCRRLKRHWFNPWVWKIPWRRA